MDNDWEDDSLGNSEGGTGLSGGRGRGFVKKPSQQSDNIGHGMGRGTFRPKVDVEPTNFGNNTEPATDDWLAGDSPSWPGNTTTKEKVEVEDDGWNETQDTNKSSFGGSSMWDPPGEDIPHGGGVRDNRRGGGGGGGGGGVCYNCNESGHMSRECPKPRQERNRNGGSGGGACFKCNQQGHISRDCPNPSSNQGERRPMTCYNCQQVGHSSRDCPNEKVERSGMGRGGGGGGGGSGCFKCGEDGHMGRDCTNPRTQSMECRNCHKEGHMAKDCPDPVIGEDGKKREPMYVPKDFTEDESTLFEGISSGINFDKYENIKVHVSGQNQVPPINSFEEAEIRDFVKQNIKKAKYVKPTPVQKYCIPIVLKGRDLMACAQTGSGKTAAYMVPIVNTIMGSDMESMAFQTAQEPLAVILSPTRELAIQIYTEAKKFANGSIVKSVVVYGGTSVSHQASMVQRGCHILVATPGRLKDFIEKGRVSLARIQFFVLDEADRMLDMGFLPDIEGMLGHSTTPSNESRVTLMFSATFPGEIQELARKFLKKDYLFVTVGEVGSANTDVEQQVKQVKKFEKVKELTEFLRENIPIVGKVLVFVETKRSADFVASLLSQHDFPATSIHGDRLQREREEAIYDFKSGKMSVLVATAVAARGLDIKGVGCVVNYDLPKTIDEYVHRIGRTGRVGNKGKAISYFDNEYDRDLVRPLVKILSDAQQVIPDWLQEELNGSGIGSYGDSGHTGFGGRDIRSYNEQKSSGDQWGPPQTVESWED